MLRCVLCGLLSLVAFASFSALGEEHHGFKLTPVLGFGISNLSMTSGTTTVNTTAGAGSAAGAFAAFGFGGPVYLETGLLAVRRKINDVSGINTSFAASYLEIPLVVRWEPVRFFSAAVGGYTAFGVGDVTTTSGTTERTQTFDSLNTKSSDLGALVSVRGAIPFNDRMAIILDARYLLGLQELSKVTGNSTKFRGLELLGGVSFGF